MLTEAGAEWIWLRAGREIFPPMLVAINAAQRSVCLEIYIFAAGYPGDAFREALVRARQRGVRVRVLIDALGSMSLPGSFWEPLRAAGGEVRQFDPLSLNRLGIRNHRKLLVCDEQVAFVGGFNIAPEYDGDGVTAGGTTSACKWAGRCRRNLRPASRRCSPALISCTNASCAGARPRPSGACCWRTSSYCSAGRGGDAAR